MDLEKQKAARERLKTVLPHLSIALAEAEAEAPAAKLILAVGREDEDGSGRITARFEADPFIDDLLALLGYESMRELILEEVSKHDETKRSSTGEDPACSTPSISSPTSPLPTTSEAR